MQTQVTVNEDILRKAMALSSFSSEQETVEQALRAYINMNAPALLSELRGKIRFSDNYNRNYNKQRQWR